MTKADGYVDVEGAIAGERRGTTSTTTEACVYQRFTPVHV